MQTELRYSSAPVRAEMGIAASEESFMFPTVVPTAETAARAEI